MASKQGIVDFLLEQLNTGRLEAEGPVYAKKMFGDYGIFCEGKMVALVCDNQLFVKQTDAGKRFVGNCEEAPPYTGAKPCFLISSERWEDAEWMAELLRVTTPELPMPQQKKVKKPLS